MLYFHGQYYIFMTFKDWLCKNCCMFSIVNYNIYKPEASNQRVVILVFRFPPLHPPTKRMAIITPAFLLRIGATNGCSRPPACPIPVRRRPRSIRRCTKSWSWDTTESASSDSSHRTCRRRSGPMVCRVAGNVSTECKKTLWFAGWAK